MKKVSRPFNCYMLFLIMLPIFSGCDKKLKEIPVWRLVDADTLFIHDTLWFSNYYKESAFGGFFWQLEFSDTSIIEYKSKGFNILHKSEISYEIHKDTLFLFYPEEYIFDIFDRTGEYSRIRTEKWLMSEQIDTLSLTFFSNKHWPHQKEQFGTDNKTYRFVRPSNKLDFPDYMVPAPTDADGVIAILDNLYTDEGKETIIHHFNHPPEREEDFFSFTIRTEIILKDMNKVIDFQNSPALQELFGHYHHEVVAGRVIGLYLDHLEGGETIPNYK